MRGMVVRRLLPLALLALLLGCARGPSLAQRLAVLVGQSEGDLVAAMGVPLRVHEAEGRRFLQFEQRRTIALAGPPSAPVYGPWGYRGWGYWPSQPAYAVIGCDITFALRGGRVESFTFRGEGCD
jgi:hypothetical protein